MPALLAAAELGPLTLLQQAYVERLRAQLTFSSDHGAVTGPSLLAAARRLEGLDLIAARETYLSAIGAAVHAGRFGTTELREAASAARSAPAGEGSDRRPADRAHHVGAGRLPRERRTAADGPRRHPRR